MAEDVDGRTDLFSLGVVLYEMLTRTLPFRGATNAALVDALLHAHPVALVRLNPDVPADLEAVVLKALEEDRRLRYQHASQLETDLTRISRQISSRRFATPDAAEAVSAPRRPPVQASRGTATRWRWVVLAASVAAVSAAAMMWQPSGSAALGDVDVILLGDIANNTGDPVFDGALRQAVAVKLDGDERPGGGGASDLRPGAARGR